MRTREKNTGVPPPVRDRTIETGGLFGPRSPTEGSGSGLARAGKDAIRLQARFPVFSMVTLTGLEWTLIGVAASASIGILLISLLDLRAHRFRLYVEAFRRRYDAHAAPLDRMRSAELMMWTLDGS
jgi:hypothetical protein